MDMGCSWWGSAACGMASGQGLWLQLGGALATLLADPVLLRDSGSADPRKAAAGQRFGLCRPPCLGPDDLARRIEKTSASTCECQNLATVYG